MIDKGLTWLYNQLPPKWKKDIIFIAIGLTIGYFAYHYYWKIREIERKATQTYNWYVKDSLKKK